MIRPPPHSTRSYPLFPSTLLFRSSMARHGFALRSIWRSKHEGKVEFVYLLDWPDAATMKAAWAAFMADPEWAAIKKETGARHGRFGDAISDRPLEPLPWSPDRAGSGG